MTSSVPGFTTTEMVDLDCCADEAECSCVDLYNEAEALRMQTPLPSALGLWAEPPSWGGHGFTGVLDPGPEQSGDVLEAEGPAWVAPLVTESLLFPGLSLAPHGKALRKKDARKKKSRAKDDSPCSSKALEVASTAAHSQSVASMKTQDSSRSLDEKWHKALISTLAEAIYLQ